MNQRTIVKQPILFAKREFKEKKPLVVEELRVKSEQFLTKGGPLKGLSIKRFIEAFYLVLVEYKGDLRIYYYSKNGKLLEAQNFENDSKFIKNIKRSTILEFHISKN